MLMSLDVMNWRIGKPGDDDTLMDIPEFVSENEKQNAEARLRLRRWITTLLDRVVFDPTTRLVELHYKWAGGALLASPRGWERYTIIEIFTLRGNRNKLRQRANQQLGSKYFSGKAD
jgi:hypothetical protein